MQKKKETISGCSAWMPSFSRMVRPMLLAMLCPLMSYADGDDDGMLVSVYQNSTVVEAAQFPSSCSLHFKVSNDGRLLMTTTNGTARAAELPLKHGATMRIRMAEHNEQNTRRQVIVSDAGYATLFSAFQTIIPSGVGVYAPTYDDAQQAIILNSGTKLPEGSILPPATGVILKNTGYYAFAYTTNTPDTPDTPESCLTGSVVATPVSDFDGTIYSLAMEDNIVGFYKYAADVTGAGKAFLVLNNVSGTSGAKVAFITDDDATSISTAPTHKSANGRTYNLAGQQVNSSYRGIVIRNGKKVAF